MTVRFQLEVRVYSELPSRLGSVKLSLLWTLLYSSLADLLNIFQIGWKLCKILWCLGSRRNRQENMNSIPFYLIFTFWILELRQYFKNKSLKGRMLTGQNLNSSKCLSKLICCCVSSFCSLCSHPGVSFALIHHILWSFHNLCHCSSYFHCLISPTISVSHSYLSFNT